jgi:hypothetical protein
VPLALYPHGLQGDELCQAHLLVYQVPLVLYPHDHQKEIEGVQLLLSAERVHLELSQRRNSKPFSFRFKDQAPLVLYLAVFVALQVQPLSQPMRQV